MLPKYRFKSDISTSREKERDTPWLPQTPPDVLGPTVRDTVFMGDRTFSIDRPDDSDKLLDHSAIKAAFAEDEYLPYWTELWPAGRMLAKVVLHEDWPAGWEALEVGCGLGLPGIAALAKGMRVTFSDCDATAVQFAANNARLNGFTDFELLQFDWRFPPEKRKWSLILASDVVYELRNINPIVSLLKKLLAPAGLCLMTDMDRLPSYNLREALDGEGFRYTARSMKAGSPGGRRQRGTLYQISRAADAGGP